MHGFVVFLVAANGMEEVNSELWRMIWKRDGLSKLCHFLWQACKGCLTVKDVLFRRHIASDNACGACGNALESIFNVLFQCLAVHQMWSLSGNVDLLNEAPSSSFGVLLVYMGLGVVCRDIVGSLVLIATRRWEGIVGVECDEAMAAKFDLQVPWSPHNHHHQGEDIISQIEQVHRHQEEEEEVIPDPQQQFLTDVNLFSFDPIRSHWEALPPPPKLSLLLRHPPFISRDLPVQSVTVGDRLAVVAGTTQNLTPALLRPVLFDPVTQDWGYGPPFPVPRRWCISGALNGSLYIISGVGPHFSTDTARSVERWDPNSHSDQKWQKCRPLRDGRFSREAADAIGCRGRLCMVNVKGDAAKQGGVYHARGDTWEEMKEGMVSGWRGPTASMDEEVVYVVDESKGVIRRYEEDRDVWVDVLESHRLRGAKQMAARGGRLCVVCAGGNEIVVVDVVAKTPKLWVVEPPHGFNVAAVHVLPRLLTNGPHSTVNHTNF
ncbi:F-box/kelch-repeat protein SKIP25 [Bienertia sinuspersici]